MIVGFVHPGNRRTYPLSSPEIARIIPRGVLDAMVAKEEGDERHSGTAITATSALGCPRALALSRAVACHAYPERLWVPFAGTLFHRGLGEMIATETDERGERVWFSEEGDPDKCVFTGNVFGTEMSVKVDHITRSCWDPSSTAPKRVIGDFKLTFSGGDKWVDPSGTAKPEHQIQLNIARILVERALHLPHGSVEMIARIVGKTWATTYAPVLSEEMMLGTAVGVTKEGEKRKLREWRFGELLQQVKVFMAWWERMGETYGGLDKVPVAEMEAKIASMPLVGKDMYMSREGKCKCNRDCQFEWDCLRISNI